MGKDLCAFDDHLVCIAVPVIAGLGKNRDGRVRDRAVILIGHDFAHQTPGGFCHGIQDGLGQAVAHGGVQPPAVYGNGFHLPAESSEGVCLPAD